MYIAPNSTIELMQGVPLEASYIHTLYWASKAAQNTYFAGKVYKSFNNYTYQKHNGQSVKIAIEMDEALSHCNYMRFKNTSFENRWFYAFITDMEYVSNGVTRIMFSLDVMQTWYFDYTPNECVVVREHTISDGIGEHILPEGLETGDYLYREAVPLELAPVAYGYSYVVVASQTPNGDQDPGFYSEIYHSCYVAQCLTDGELDELITAYMAGVTQSLEPIIAIYQVPPFFFGIDDSGKGYKDFTNPSPIKPNFIYPGDSQSQYYTPKNNKLFVYPYNFMTMQVPNGTSIALKYEGFQETDDVTIRAYGCVLPSPEVQFVPLFYYGVDANLPNGLDYANFPTCAVASDAYSAWWAQNKASYPSGVVDSSVNITHSGMNSMVNAINNVAANDADDALRQRAAYSGPLESLFAQSVLLFKDIAATLGSGFNRAADTIVGSVSGAIGNLEVAKNVIGEYGSELQAKENHKAMPDTVISKAAGGGIDHAFNRNTAIIYNTQINRKFAKTIDDYFTRFGYLVNTIKQPSFHNRTKWTYVKTSGVTINTNIPFQYEEAICKILNNGITFWVNPSEVGDYTLNNALLT